MKLSPLFQILFFLFTATSLLNGFPVQEAFEQREEEHQGWTAAQQAMKDREIAKGKDRFEGENNFSRGGSLTVADADTTEPLAENINSTSSSQGDEGPLVSTDDLINNDISNVSLNNSESFKAGTMGDGLVNAAAAMFATPQKKKVTFFDTPISPSLERAQGASSQITSSMLSKSDNFSRAITISQRAIANVTDVVLDDDENIPADEGQGTWKEVGLNDEEFKAFDQQRTAALNEIKRQLDVCNKYTANALHEAKLLKSNTWSVAHNRFVKVRELTEKAFSSEACKNLKEAEAFRKTAEQYEESSRFYVRSVLCYCKLYGSGDHLEVEMEKNKKNKYYLQGRALGAAGLVSTLAAQKMEEAIELKDPRVQEKGRLLSDIGEKYSQAAVYYAQAADVYEMDALLLECDTMALKDAYLKAGHCLSNAAQQIEKATNAKSLGNLKREQIFRMLAEEYEEVRDIFDQAIKAYNDGREITFLDLFEKGCDRMKTLKEIRARNSSQRESESTTPGQQDAKDQGFCVVS